MDKVSDYLADRPEGATAEDIAREALGLKGAVGPVANQVIRAAAETDSRITLADDGLWTLRKTSGRKGLRSSPYATIVLREDAEGALDIAVTRATFDGEARTESFHIVRGRSETAARELDRLGALIEGAVLGGFRYASIRGSLNGVSRLQVGREVLRPGLCLTKLARRCFPEHKIRSCGDIASALDLPHVESVESEAMTRYQSDLLVGLLEKFEAREICSVEEVLEDLKPMVSSVDFEAFAFDEDYLDDLPGTPGVYVMRDADGRVIYVGKSVHLRDRVKTYFAKRSEREEKTLKILSRIWTVEILEVGSELEALILEARLIQATRPEFNKQVEVHERQDASDRGPYLLALPSAESASVQLFCVRSDREILAVGVRKDLNDWPDGWSRISTFFLAGTTDLDEGELAAHHILNGWVRQNVEKINLIDVGDAGGDDNLRRLLEEQIQAADDEAWEKVWRV